ncbi:hypothetical protein [Aquimarina sp. 2201CG5-10]|uniref:dioxygenase family protein n=1 Tax=Aquimarina callyspongiae TaxID=3098150 RepID=UPI002AB35B66|nr:hypothetical protein [Aquimarina sp. 2201CG5-10]MDY8134460.1 hypothetical protein [Aquimarina sp. 2201CG5-10]
MNRLILITFFLSLLSCSIDRTIIATSETENQTLLNFQKLQKKSILKIADKNEPGEKLLLCLTFIDKESKRTLSNQLVKFYHTSTDGKYEPTDPSDESTARLNGQSLTNNKGQIYIETILPGDYGSSADNRHIHTTVFGAHPEAYDIHFKQYTTYMGTNFNEGSDQHFLADLKKTKKNELVSFLIIEIKNPDQQKK